MAPGIIPEQAHVLAQNRLKSKFIHLNTNVYWSYQR